MQGGRRGEVCSRVAGRPRAAAAALLGVALMAGAFLAVPAGAEVPFNRGTAQDALGDVLTPDAEPTTVPAVDIIGATLEYASGWIRAEVRTFSFTDPVKDERWQSDDTYAVWSLDTTGDGQTDFLVEYGITSDKELYGDVHRADSGPDDPAVCGADSVSYSSTAMGGIYELRLDPECLGRPATIAYTVGMTFDTGGGRLAGPIGTDIVPNRGFAAPVPAPAPVAAPGPASVSPLAAPTTALQAAAPSTTAPPATAPAAQPKAAPAGPAPRTAVSTKPRRVVTPTSAPTPPKIAVPPSPAASPSSVASVKALPRTGAERASLAAFGIGVLLLGIGLMVMASPGHSRSRSVGSAY